MKISIISGSHRKDAQSLKVAQYVATELAKKSVETYILSLSENPLPLWDEEKWDSSNNKWKTLWQGHAEQLKASDGFVIISPEWSGMASASLKNFFLLCDGNELAHKPAMIVSVSGSIGGSYPVAELRMSSYKNTRINYIPDHMVVRNVTTVLNVNTPVDKQTEEDKYIRARMNYSLDVLLKYADAMKPIWSWPELDYKNYPYGM